MPLPHSLAHPLTASLGALNPPIVTRYRLGVTFHRLSVRKDPVAAPEKKAFDRTIEALLNAGILHENKDFPGGAVFNILGKTRSQPIEIACAVDPFAFASHLSAMEYHGLTDRIPRTLYLSSPPPRQWRRFALERMKKDLGADLAVYLRSGLPRLTRVRFTRIGRTPVHIHAAAHRGAFKAADAVRVSTIGRTFLDMLRRPRLCGGIRHVIDVYRNHAQRYLRLIVDEIDRHGAPIDKVRAGYILEEVCRLQDPVIDGWTRYAQRGGSRKLVYDADYSPVYSERWCLSINLESA